jgi:hypothetical protein
MLLGGKRRVSIRRFPLQPQNDAWDGVAADYISGETASLNVHTAKKRRAHGDALPDC